MRAAVRQHPDQEPQRAPRIPGAHGCRRKSVFISPQQCTRQKKGRRFFQNNHHAGPVTVQCKIPDSSTSSAAKSSSLFSLFVHQLYTASFFNCGKNKRMSCDEIEHCNECADKQPPLISADKYDERRKHITQHKKNQKAAQTTQHFCLCFHFIRKVNASPFDYPAKKCTDK